MKKIIILLSALIGLNSAASSQNFQQDLLRMKEAMLELGSCRSIITTKIYSDQEANKVVQQSRREIIQKGWQSFSKSKEMDILLNEKYVLVHHQEQALLSIQKHDLKASHLANIGLEEIEKVVAQTQSITYKGIFNNTKCYIIKPLRGPVEILEFYFDASSGLPVKEVRYFHAELDVAIARSEMDYQFLDIGKAFADRQFSEQKYVKVNSDGLVKLAPAYRHYQLIVGEGLKAENF